PSLPAALPISVAGLRAQGVEALEHHDLPARLELGEHRGEGRTGDPAADQHCICAGHVQVCHVSPFAARHSPRDRPALPCATPGGRPLSVSRLRRRPWRPADGSRACAAPPAGGACGCRPGDRADGQRAGGSRRSETVCPGALWVFTTVLRERSIRSRPTRNSTPPATIRMVPSIPESTPGRSISSAKRAI